MVSITYIQLIIRKRKGVHGYIYFTWITDNSKASIVEITAVFASAGGLEIKIHSNRGMVCESVWLVASSIVLDSAAVHSFASILYDWFQYCIFHHWFCHTPTSLQPLVATLTITLYKIMVSFSIYILNFSVGSN